jgi:outer membrane protein OmpA-like peptidoglycan-associated protein
MSFGNSTLFLVGVTAVIGFGTGAALVVTQSQRDVAAAAPAQALTEAPAQVDQAAARDAQNLAALKKLTEAQTQLAAQEVSRDAPVDLLEVTPAQPSVAAPAQPTKPEPIDTASSASFFTAAQEKLSAQETCGDDLRALAAGTRVYFPSGGLSGSDAGLVAARLIGQVASACPGYTVQVEGHSDASGDPRINQRLSEERARSVVSRLGSSGIDTSRFVAVGFGDTRPSSVTGPQDDAYYDRRVEFSVIEDVQTASLGGAAQGGWQQPGRQITGCAAELESLAAQSRIFFSERAITVTPSDMETARNLALRAQACDGARLRVFGHFSDAPGSRESVGTARLRALALMSSLVAGGIPSEQILVGAPSRSIGVPGQPGLPNSRIDFQIVTE